MRKSTLFITGLLAVLAATTTRAQVFRGPAAGGEGQISAMGHVHLQRPPTHLRMYVQLTGKGKTLEEALAALTARREAVAAQLQKLGVEKSALVFAPPNVDESQAAQQRRMEAMLAQKISVRGAKKDVKPAKPAVAVTSLLTAQWPLAGDTVEKLLLAAESVREKVKAVDLTGGKEAPKLSPEEQEAAEEMAAETARNMGYSGAEQVNPDEPRFVFVARLSPQDRQTALAEAFTKAKTQAAELAKAAGAGLGPLTGLSGEAGGGISYANSMARYNYSNRSEYEFMQQVAMAGGPEEPEGETIAPTPGAIGFDFVVTATFAVETAKLQK